LSYEDRQDRLPLNISFPLSLFQVLFARDEAPEKVLLNRSNPDLPLVTAEHTEIAEMNDSNEKCS